MDSKDSKGQKKDMLVSSLNTAEWMVSALAVTVIFLVFIMQAYTIPTGSMADTLTGAHFRLRCRQCGYKYDYDYTARYYKLPENKTPNKDLAVLPPEPRCPSCGYFRKGGIKASMVAGQRVYKQFGEKATVVAGDRIFVFKAIYQFFEPRRWDVVVFKNPREPRINYIKRLIAKPGEELTVIDGDIYINGQIARKPKRVQNELWSIIYDNNFQPVNPQIPRYNWHKWKNPFVNESGSGWKINSENNTVFALDGNDENVHVLFYDTQIGNNFRAVHAYDPSELIPSMPLVSDLKICFDVEGSPDIVTGAGLSKYGIEYKALVEPGKKMVLAKINENGSIKQLASMKISDTARKITSFEFSNVDHMLVLKFGKDVLRYNLGSGPDDAGPRNTKIMPAVRIFGTGKMQLRNIAVYRDQHYISNNLVDKSGRNIMPIKQGREGVPFVLGPDEYFVMGDNTPASADSRVWDKPGIGNNSKEYRQGIVPQDYMVGKAFVVYWPGPTKPLEKFKMIPYWKGLKFIVGGSDKLY